jgi:hypothetical protein
MRRLAVFLLGLAAAGAAAQEPPPAAPESDNPQPEYFAPPASTSRFELRWDALVRYDAIDLDRQSPAHDIHRWRTEVRPEADWLASDRFRIGVRVLGELSSDSNATNDARLDNYRSNTAALDRFFVEARPGNFTLIAGQFGMPLRTTEMLWDQDIQVLGAAGSWRAPLSAETSVTLAGGFFYGPQREHDQAHVAAGQATLATRLGPVELSWSEAYWRFTHLARTAEHFLRQNVSYSGSAYGGPSYTDDFRILDSLLRARFPIAGVPVTLSADWTHNFAASEAEYRDGLELALRVGREGDPGDWEVFDVYQMVDRDAVVGAYNTDDWWFHSWYVGHRVGVAVTVLPQVMLRPSVVFQRRQDRDHYLNRYLIDLVKTF